jgi:hypothetical protein
LVPGQKVTIWAGYEDVKRELLDVVDSCRSDRVGLSEFVVLHGEYGTGKSHDLRYLQYYITEAHAVAFLKEVLRSYRADPNDPDEYPFREVALRKIAEETTEKTAANLFRGCRRVLEKAVLAGRLQPGGWIEVEDVREFL